MQASYRVWHTRCVPQCERACEQVARCWADASLEDIATNGKLSMAARTPPKTKYVMTSFSLLRWPILAAQTKRKPQPTLRPVGLPISASFCLSRHDRRGRFLRDVQGSV